MPSTHSRTPYQEGEAFATAQLLQTIAEALATHQAFLRLLCEVLAQHQFHNTRTATAIPSWPHGCAPPFSLDDVNGFLPPTIAPIYHPLNSNALDTVLEDPNMGGLEQRMRQTSLSSDVPPFSFTGATPSSSHPQDFHGVEAPSYLPAYFYPSQQGGTANASSTGLDNGGAPPQLAGQTFTPAEHQPLNSPPLYHQYMEQGHYHGRFSEHDVIAGPIPFNGGDGVILGDLAALENGNDAAFPPEASTGVKASIRFLLAECPEEVPRQVRVRHGEGKRGIRGRPAPFTVREMAELVKSELNRLSAQHGPLLHNGRPVDVDEIVLMRIEHVSKGSFQPILAMRSGT